MPCIKTCPSPYHNWTGLESNDAVHAWITRAARVQMCLSNPGHVGSVCNLGLCFCCFIHVHFSDRLCARTGLLLLLATHVMQDRKMGSRFTPTLNPTITIHDACAAHVTKVLLRTSRHASRTRHEPTTSDVLSKRLANHHHPCSRCPKSYKGFTQNLCTPIESVAVP